MSPDKNEKKEDLNLIVRIFSTDIKGDKKVLVGLTKIRGIDQSFSNAILKVTGISRDKLIGKLNDDEISKIEDVIKNPVNFKIPEFMFNRSSDPETGKPMHIVGSDLKLQNDFDIRRMNRIRSYKGLRHAWKLKVRGQRLKHYRKGGSAISQKKKVKK